MTRAGRSIRFLLIVAVTAAVAVGAFVLIGQKASHSYVSPGAAEAQIQDDLQRRLERAEPDDPGQVRDVSCLRRSGGHDLKCIADLDDHGDDAKMIVDVSAGDDGSFIWEARP